jgi:hypothetical protein
VYAPPLGKGKPYRHRHLLQQDRDHHGGASGIGRAGVAELVRRGAHVWLADINGHEAESVAEAMSGSGSACGWRWTWRSAPAVEALVGLVFKKHGRLDLMFKQRRNRCSWQHPPICRSTTGTRSLM